MPHLLRRWPSHLNVLLYWDWQYIRSTQPAAERVVMVHWCTCSDCNRWGGESIYEHVLTNLLTRIGMLCLECSSQLGRRGAGPELGPARTKMWRAVDCRMWRAVDDAHGRPGQQWPIRPLAASLASSCPISSPWPAAAGGGSGRMSRPSGRRPSSCDQCCSTAATELRRGRPQARWPTAMDGELGARGRAARALGRSAGCRGARRRGTYWHTHRHSTCASLPGCCSPLAPVAAQVADPRRRRRRRVPPEAVGRVRSEWVC